MEHINLNTFEFKSKRNSRIQEAKIREWQRKAKRDQLTNDILNGIIKMLVVITIIHIAYRVFQYIGG